MRITRPVAALACLVVILAAGVAAIALRGLAADEPPNAVETMVARRLVVLSIPLAARRASNPLATDESAWRAGAEHFDEHCAMCHGSDGRGGTAIGRAMYPPVPDLGGPAVQDLSDGALFSIIQHGVRWTGMPAFRASHTSDDTWRLVAFIRRLPRAGREARHDEPAGHEHGGPGGHEHGGPGKRVTVVMDGTTFRPGEITVAAGDVVVWRNDDPFPHTVVSAAGGWRSSELPPAAEWEWKASTPGTFRYVCTLHPGMNGLVHVR